MTSFTIFESDLLSKDLNVIKDKSIFDTTENKNLKVYRFAFKISSKEEIPLIKPLIEKFHIGIRDNTKAVFTAYNLPNEAIDKEKIIDNFTFIEVDGNHYAFNVLANYEKGNVHYDYSKKITKKLFNAAEKLSDSEYKKIEPQLIEMLQNNRKETFTRPLFKSFSIEIVAIAEPKL